MHMPADPRVQQAQAWPVAEPGQRGAGTAPPGADRQPGQERSQQHNVAVQLAELAARSGWLGRRAFIQHGREWTHREVHLAAAATAGLFADLGVGEGDRVLIALHDRIGFVLAFLGAAHLGAIAVPANPRLPPKDHAFMVKDAAPALVVCEPELVKSFTGVPVLTAPELETGGSSHAPAPAASLPATAPLYAQYTSGTTGTPKLVVHRHADPLWHAVAVSQGVLGIVPDDVVFSVSRTYFSYGLGNTLFCALSTGASAALQPELPTIAAVTELVRSVRASVLFAVPSFYAVLVAEGDRDAFSSLRVAVSAGEALSPALCARASGFLAVPVLDCLGSTEAGQLFIANTLVRRRDGSCGVVLAGYEISVRDDKGAEVAPGHPGALWVRGPTIMTGYRNRPTETARVLVGGWLRTGDRVQVDAEGFVHHCGRVDDLEMIGGITVSPLEIEAVLGSHDAVAEVAIAAVPDSRGASRLRAFVITAPGYSWSAELEAELILFARAHLASYKVPRSVLFVSELPRTQTGKLRRHVLRSGWPLLPDPAGPGPASG